MPPKKSADKTVDDGDSVLSLQQEVDALKQQLMTADEQYAEEIEKSNERQRVAAQTHDDLHIHYQRRISSMLQNRDNNMAQMQDEIDQLRSRLRSAVTMPISGDDMSANVLSSGMAAPPPTVANSMDGIELNDRSHGEKFNVPLPRQHVFDGKSSWDSFSKPFEAVARSCGWSESDKLFRLTSSLRGEAAEFAFNQLTPKTLSAYVSLKYALEVRFKERRTASSYLNELESRRYTPKEKLLEYAADVKRLVLKGYPTADEETREAISVRCFLKGFQDQNMAVAVGMKDPQTVNDAREMIETYNSLKDDVGRGQKVNVRAIQPGKQAKNASPMTEQDIRRIVLEVLKQHRESEKREKLDKRPVMSKVNIECFKCHQLGHYANECHQKRGAGDKNELN